MVAAYAFSYHDWPATSRVAPLLRARLVEEYVEGHLPQFERPTLIDQPIQPPRRTHFIDVADGVIRAGRKLGAIDPAQLDKNALLDGAMQATGLDDFGDDWFERPFDALLDSVKSEAWLNAAGDLSAMKQFHHILRDRLYAQMWFKRHPEILARPLRNPVVIVGPMRSGTTRLHRLLAGD